MNRPMLGSRALRWLKCFHLLAVSCWVGGAVALTVLACHRQFMDDAAALYGLNVASCVVDMQVVVLPGAYGCLITGLIYGLFTRFGFFRHGWLILKWIITVTAILFGMLYLGPWEEALRDLSLELGPDVFTNSEYLRVFSLHSRWGQIQAFVLVLTIFLSVFKPWKNLRTK